MNIRCFFGHEYKRIPIPTFNLINFDVNTKKNDSFICRFQRCDKMKVFYEKNYKGK